jgi:hopene-associated glycosyltransferase HpnB
VDATSAAVGLLALACWLGVLVHPARPWDLRPRDGGPRAPDPESWPSVCVLVPARDEAELLPRTLPALLAQDYPGEWKAVVVDDRSSDGTAATARGHATARLEVVEGAALPEGWVGKVWALEQGLARAGEPRYLLLTDADIEHAPGSLRALVAEAEAHGLALDSRMALLHATGVVERLLVPAFAFFFALLYPMRWAGDPRRRLAAAAGGCVLVRRDALLASGGFAGIRGAVIDDVALARQVKRSGGAVRLAASEGTVRSLRHYPTLWAFWRTVRRTAFTQLRHSRLLLAATLVGLALLFAAPPVLVALGAAGVAGPLPLGAGAAAWAVSAAVYLPATRLYRLSPLWALALPAAGVLYGAMTLDSGLRHRRGPMW